MSIFIKKDKKRAALEKEYASVLKKETQLKQSAMKTTAPRWKTDLEKKVPEKVYRSLETAFSKAFSVVFTQGVGVIEKTYNRQNLDPFRSGLCRPGQGWPKGTETGQAKCRSVWSDKHRPDNCGRNRPWGTGHWPAGYRGVCRYVA